MFTEELMQGLSGMDPMELALGAGVLGAFAVLAVIGQLLWFFVSAFGYRKMFLKSGEAGWKAFVPYYKHFICFKFAWNTKMFWPFLVSLLLMQAMPDSEGLVKALISIACIVIFVVLDVKLNIRVAASFGKSTGWGVLLFFFPFVVSFILGFGKAEYIGNTTAETTAE